jgi:hypothetical protein
MEAAMRLSEVLAFSTASLSLICAADAMAQVRPAPANGYDQAGTSTSWDAFASRERVTRDAKRLRLAQKAAKLINDGHCPEALDVARSAEDSDMATRITQVCAPPKAQAAATRTTAPAPAPSTPR